MRRLALAHAGRLGAAALAAVALVLAAGCVSKKDYLARTQEAVGLNARVTHLERQLADTEGRVTVLSAERDRLGSELAAARGEAARLAEQIADAAARREALERELALAREAAAKTDGSLKDVSARYDALIRDLERQKGEAAKRAADLAGWLAEAESRMATLTADLATSRQGHAAALEELAATRASLGETQEQLAERERKLREAAETYDRLVGDLKQEISDGQVKITRLRDRLTLNLVDRILFDSGSATIKPNGKKILLKVADGLRGVKKDKRIQIEGHTDDVPIKGALTKRFPTNWELSTARATSVARFLQEQGKLDPARLTAAGYGPYRPVASNETPKGRTENRRIEIVLVPAASDEAL